MAPRSARFHGTLTSWNDDRGFGFISLADGDARGDRKTFVHIKAFPAALHRRPQIGDRLSFELGPSPEGKSQAEFVQLAGPTPATRQRHPASRRTSRAASYLPILLFAVGYLAVDAYGRSMADPGNDFAPARLPRWLARRNRRAADAATQDQEGELSFGILGNRGGQCHRSAGVRHADRVCNRIPARFADLASVPHCVLFERRRSLAAVK
jgi:cold shock CspA family protein